MPAPGGRAWYRFVTPQSSVPLLMLQGGPGVSPGYFEPLVTLSEERPVVLYDGLDGLAADDPHGGGHSLTCLIDRFRQLRASLGLIKVHVLGYGLGAWSALDYALTQPEGLVSLILNPPDPAAFIQYVCLSLQARVLHPEHLSAPRDGRLARLDEIRVPTLLIWDETASRDRDFSRCEGRLLPGWQLALLKGGFGGLEREEWFVRTVSRFLASVEQSTRGAESPLLA
jgi:hypothetical protein